MLDAESIEYKELHINDLDEFDISRLIADVRSSEHGGSGTVVEVLQTPILRNPRSGECFAGMIMDSMTDDLILDAVREVIRS